MKINSKKAVVATMAIAMAAGIAGSISGTVAWFQYNTRVTTEFTGTTAKCTEFLQVRTVKQTISVTTAVSSLPTSGTTLNNTYLVKTTSSPKIYKCTAVEDGNTLPVFEEVADVINNAIYKDSSNALHMFNGSAWSTPSGVYGDWTTSLTDADIAAATGGTSQDGLKPVTLPGVVQNATVAASNFYGQPVAGHEQYAAGDYKWQEAETSDYYGFDLQFRVLDIDGTETDGSPVLYAQSLYLTDITVAQYSGSSKGDISSAVRVYLSDSSNTSHALLAPGANTTDATVSTVTHGVLDLGGKEGNDTLLDVPGNHYSFNTTATVLDYGKDKPTQVAYNMNKKMAKTASNGLYPINDGEGHLSGGAALATTVASDGTAALSDTAYATIGVKIFLEGWQQLGTKSYTVAGSADQFAASAPSNPSAGDTYINTADAYLYTYGNGSWAKSESQVADGSYYTVNGVDYKLTVTGDTTKTVTYAAQPSLSIWDSATYVGAKFNIGMSFGVTTLD